MGYQHGLAALRLEWTDTVPRTEYSVESHWELIQAVTGIDTSAPSNRPAAQTAFIAKSAIRVSWESGSVSSLMNFESSPPI